MGTLPANEKFRELILYLSELSEGDRSFGAVKLNKLLFYCDFNAYRFFGRSVTGQEYQKLPQGPCPRRLKPVFDRMKSDGELAVREREYYGRTQNRPFALREPKLDVFSAKEIDLINRVVERFRSMNASAISAASHAFNGWICAEMGETIPYEVALLGASDPSDADLERCRLAVHLAEECLS